MISKVKVNIKYIAQYPVISTQQTEYKNLSLSFPYLKVAYLVWLESVIGSNDLCFVWYTAFPSEEWNFQMQFFLEGGLRQESAKVSTRVWTQPICNENRLTSEPPLNVEIPVFYYLIGQWCSW